MWLKWKVDGVNCGGNDWNGLKQGWCFDSFKEQNWRGGNYYAKIICNIGSYVG